MKAAFYIGTRSGLAGVGSVVTRFRLSGLDGLTGKNSPMSQISHCELVFEPGDGVEKLMPQDGLTMLPTAQPIDGAHWCASSSATDEIPRWSDRRAGKAGGVRFKRIDVSDPRKWLLIDLGHADARRAAAWFREHEGALYDWQAIVGFVAWPIPHKADRYACHEAVGAALGVPEPDRLDPAALCAVLQMGPRA